MEQHNNKGMIQSVSSQPSTCESESKYKRKQNKNTTYITQASKQTWAVADKRARQIRQAENTEIALKPRRNVPRLTFKTLESAFVLIRPSPQRRRSPASRLADS